MSPTTYRPELAEHHLESIVRGSITGENPDQLEMVRRRVAERVLSIGEDGRSRWAAHVPEEYREACRSWARMVLAEVMV